MKLSLASDLMLRFAERTGLMAGGVQRRYLWTDAFAVCNLLGLARATGLQRYQELALGLVDRVHHTLGRHRGDDGRAGWLSGLGAGEGERHPTRGGLRIGKTLSERRPSEPWDERLEWDRDGQYFHYLTKWMHALDQTARATGQTLFNVWARELAQVSYERFTSGGGRRLAWKMSIDLSRPLVASMGRHDPLDGFVTCAELRATAAALAGAPAEPDLRMELSGLALLAQETGLATADPLGIGGLLADACCIDQLLAQESFSDAGLLRELLSAALEGLRLYAYQPDLREPASRRLAFRELGLAIGLLAVPHIRRRGEVKHLLEALDVFVPLGAAIESFWLEPAHREAASFVEHRDINEVMLATRLAPEGFLLLSR
jgi:hypothetical protein